MRFLLVFMLACSSSSSSKPDPASPAAPEPDPAPSTTVMTKEECEAKGGRLNASMGGGDQAHCNDDETELGPVRFGIEGGWCCQKK